ncbi:MAG: acyl-CoA desaturase [Deltaproteobacteria bacterium]|nr:acyl-CoA desaturase [Deltaproteobacteria bacterium]
MSTSSWVAIVALYPVIVLVGLTNTVGYHRLLTHGSFKTKKWLRYAITFVCAQYSGSPMAWVGAHRVHHTISDTEGDPHTPVRGFWFAHCGWLFGGVKNPVLCILFALSGFGLQLRFFVVDIRRILGKVKPTWRTMTRDLGKERFMRALDVPLVISACFAAQVAAAWFLGGWWGIAWLWLVHVVLNNATWAVNSICHWPGMGTRPHETRDRSRNVAWLAIVTHGESHHNAHHKHPRSARHGIDGGHDLSWTVIRGLSKIGLAWDVQLPVVRAPKNAPAATLVEQPE